LTRGVSNLGGSEGNARLTSATAVVLLVLLGVEGITILFIQPLISTHVFVGLLLVPPVALKLASAGWRFVRYYTHSPEYVAKGPPHPVLRVLVAPVVVASTLVLFGTGIAMLAVHPRAGPLVGIHKVSFVVWLVATGVHVLAYLTRLPGLASADWRSRTRETSSVLRLVTVASSLALGAVFAASALHLASPWVDRVHGHHDERPSRHGLPARPPGPARARRTAAS